MAIIPQKKLFGWKEIEILGDLERFLLVIKYMPDEKLMRVVEEETKALGRPWNVVYNYKGEVFLS